MTDNRTILVVDDEADIRDMIVYHLEKGGYIVHPSADGESALTICESVKPNLILLDLMLPGIDGHQVCYKLKMNPKLKHIPVIMLTAKDEEVDELFGLKIGADDYIRKPFSPRILLARIDTLLRRYETVIPGEDDEEIIVRGNFTFNNNRHQLLVDDQEIKTTAVEYRILNFLAKRPGWVYRREQIIEGAIGEGVFVTERTIDVHIATLRKKLGKASNRIETVHGIGYKFRE